MVLFYCLYFYYLFCEVVVVFAIIKITPVKINKIPVVFLKVKCSENNKIPKKIAVNGSSAPKIAVFVEPINFMASVIVSNEIIVGITAKHNTNIHKNGLSKICKFVQNFRLTTNSDKPNSIT